jgi:RNA polymerase-binding transcription factor DksA
VTTEELQHARERLEAMRAEQQAIIADMATGEDQVIPSDPQHAGDLSDDSADDADPMFDAEMNMSLVRNAQDILDLINLSLQRIDAGTYGLCSICGKAIDERRLEVLPYAQYCLDDQQKQEALTEASP